MSSTIHTVEDIERNMKLFNIPVFIFDKTNNQFEMVLVSRLSLLSNLIFLKLTPLVSKNVEIPLTFHYGFKVTHDNGENANMMGINKEEIEALKTWYFTHLITQSRAIDKPHKDLSAFKDYQPRKSRFAPKLL